MLTKNTPFHSNRVRKQVSEKPAGFSFMKKVVDACARFGIPEVSQAIQPDDKIYFHKDGEVISLVTTTKIPQNAVGIMKNTVLRHSELIPPDFPIYKRNELIDCITLGSANGSEIAVSNKTQSFGSLLSILKNSFTMNDQVNKIDTLYEGDRMFVHLENDTYAYSISVRDSSKKINGESRALCEITYRENIENTHTSREVTREGIIILPLTLGSKIHFTYYANKKLHIAPELNKVIQGIQYKRKIRAK